MKYNILIALLFFSFILFAQQKGVTPINNQQSTNNNQQTYAVVVGISDYQDEGIPDLRFADKDAEAFANFLRSPAGGSLDEDHLELLLNEEATGGKMAAALYWLLDECKEGDNVIIYFSGHGDVETKTMFQLGYLLNWDSPPDTYMAGAFNIRDLQAIVSTLTDRNKARVTLITDACRSGKLAGSNIDGPQITSANLSARISNEIKILSCQPDEYSIEGEQWGGGRGAFSYHLVNGLYGMADGNNDLTINLLELGRYLQDKVSEEVAPHNQMPMFVGNNREEMAMVDATTLEQIRNRDEGQIAMFKSTETRGMEEEILAQVDSATQALYASFNQSLKSKKFLFPEEACADFYYSQLIQNPMLERLHSSMRRNYAAALQDDAQQVINDKLKSEYTTCVIDFQAQYEKYKHYPAYLQRTIELLGEQHYMYPILKARRAYFEGYTHQMKHKTDRRGYDPKAELNLYEEALQYNPDMPLALIEMAYILAFEFNQPAVADSLYQQTLDQNPNWIFGYSEYKFLADNKLYDEKISKWCLDQAFAIDSNALLSINLLANYYEGKGEFKNAINYHVKLFSGTANSCGFIKSAWGLIKLHRFKEIQNILENNIDIDTTSATYYGMLGMMNASIGEQEKAETLIQKVLDIDPESNVLAGLSAYYVGVENWSKALDIWRSRAVAVPWNDYYQANVANYLTILGDLQAAEKVLNQIHTNDPLSEYHTLVKAYSDIANKDYVAAEKVLQYGISLGQKRKYRMQLLLGHVFIQTGRQEEGVTMIQEAYSFAKIQDYYSKWHYFYTLTGGLFRNAGRYEEAAQLFEPMLEFDDTDPLIYVELSRTAAAAGEKQKAFSYIEKALKYGYEDLDQLKNNVNLKRLHDMEGWDALLNKHFPNSHKN